MTASNGPLEGLRVVELSGERTALAGKMMADMGADVIVVEPPSGSPLRTRPPFVDDQPGPERSLTWWHYNTSKRGVTLDLGRTEDEARFHGLLGDTDVLLDGDLELDHELLGARHPRLVVVSITPFGRSGPRRDEQATDLTLLAGGGPVWSCGYDDHALPPIRGWGEQSSNIGALYAVTGALVALVSRDDTDAGQCVDVNLHAAANVTAEQATYLWLLVGQTVQRQTGRHAEVQPSLPTQVRCLDGRYVNTGVPPRVQREFQAVHDWMRELGLLDEFRDRIFLEMGADRERLDLSRIAEDAEVQAIFAAGREALTLIASRMESLEFFRKANARGMPVGIIYSPEELFEDEHFVARGFPTPVQQPGREAPVIHPGPPIRFEGSPAGIRCAAPRLGEHNEEVFPSPEDTQHTKNS